MLLFKRTSSPVGAEVLGDNCSDSRRDNRFKILTPFPDLLEVVSPILSKDVYSVSNIVLAETRISFVSNSVILSRITRDDAQSCDMTKTSSVFPLKTVEIIEVKRLTRLFHQQRLQEDHKTSVPVFEAS